MGWAPPAEKLIQDFLRDGPRAESAILKAGYRRGLSKEQVVRALIRLAESGLILIESAGAWTLPFVRRTEFTLPGGESLAGTGVADYDPAKALAAAVARLEGSIGAGRESIRLAAYRGKLKRWPRWLMSPAQKRADNRRRDARRKDLRHARMAKYQGKYGDGGWCAEDGGLAHFVRPCPRGLHDLGLDGDGAPRANPAAVDSEGRCRVCRRDDKRLLRLERRLGPVGRVIRALGGRGLDNDWWYLRDEDSGEYRHGGYRVPRIRRALELLWDRLHPPVYVPDPDVVL